MQQTETIDDSAMSVQERRKLVENIFIIYPKLKQIIEKISECHQGSKDAPEPKCLFITGMAGCGKTTIARHYESLYPRQETEGGTVSPVLSSTIFSPATVKGLSTGLLYSLGDPLADRGSITSQTTRLYKLVRKCGVELIILDEFQHLIDRDSDKVLKVASDWLKNLLNYTGVPVVLIGMPSSVRILRDNEQLKRRFSARKDLLPFGWETADRQADFIRFLKTLEKMLPLKEPSRLYSFETAFRIFCASGGVISNIMKIVRKAALLALERSQESISLDLLAIAYEDEIASVNPTYENPFLTDADKLSVPEQTDEASKTDLAGRKGRGSGKRISEVLRK